MSRKTRTRPTLLQSNLGTVLILLLSFMLSPITLVICLVCYLISLPTFRFFMVAKTTRSKVRTSSRTVLITGARANKALTLIRAFKCEGHRVIVAEEEKWGKYAISRFSRAVDSHYPLPDPLANSDSYARALKDIVMRECVDAWVPCSSVQATMVDSEAAREIRRGNLGGSLGCECFIPEPPVCGTLHWKDQFENLLKEIDLPAPHSKIVTNVRDGVDFLHSPETQSKGHKYLLKSLTLDDLGRDDVTLLPLATREETEHHLSHIPTPLSEQDPFLLQQFLRGPEYCTHVAARDGKMVAFVACRSNEFLLRYVDVQNLGMQESEMGKRLEEWSQRFLDLYKAKLEREGKTGPEYELTGHFSFDFIYETNERILYVLECNVRAHTAVALLSDHPTLGSHYLGMPDTSEPQTIARPRPGTPARSWLAHALPLTIARCFPRRWCNIIHPQLLPAIWSAVASDPTASPLPEEMPIPLLKRYLIDGSERDGVWDWTDPMPFFALCHITWPWLLLRLMWRGVAWSRVNVSTSRVFEC